MQLMVTPGLGDIWSMHSFLFMFNLFLLYCVFQFGFLYAKLECVGFCSLNKIFRSMQTIPSWCMFATNIHKFMCDPAIGRDGSILFKFM